MSTDLEEIFFCYPREERHLQSTVALMLKDWRQWLGMQFSDTAVA